MSSYRGIRVSSADLIANSATPVQTNAKSAPQDPSFSQMEHAHAKKGASLTLFLKAVPNAKLLVRPALVLTSVKPAQQVPLSEIPSACNAQLISM